MYHYLTIGLLQVVCLTLGSEVKEHSLAALLERSASEGASQGTTEKFIIHGALEDNLSSSECETNSLEGKTSSMGEEERIFIATSKSRSCWFWLQKRIKTNTFLILGQQPDNLDKQIRQLQVQSDKLTCLLKESGYFVTPVVYDGSPGASSKWSADYSAQKAFNQANPEARWCSTEGYPGKIWFQFTSAVKVVKISFSSIDSNQHPNIWTESPKAFNVIASNDCSTWDTLLSVTNSGFTGLNQEKSWHIPCTQQKSYRCYGIEGIENLGYPKDYISLKDMKMFQ